HARGGELSVRLAQLLAASQDASVLEVGPQERDEREREQDGERDRSAWERRARDFEVEDERSGRREVERVCARRDAVASGAQPRSLKLRVVRELLFDDAPLGVAQRKRVLELFGECSARARARVNDQPVLRVLKAQRAAAQLFRLYRARGRDARQPQDGRERARLVTREAPRRADEKRPALARQTLEATRRADGDIRRAVGDDACP